MAKLKQMICVGSIASLFTLQALAAAGTQLNNASQKLSYTIGYEMGENFKHQQITIDPAILAAGLKDGLAGSKPLLTKQQRQETIATFQKQVIAKQETEFKKLAQANEKAGEAFLKANAKKTGVKTLADGLQYKIIKAGNGPIPAANDTVTVNYAGTFINGKTFDSSYDRGKPTTFPLNQVIQGWQEALTKMPVGSVWEVYVPAKLAYGAQGMGNVIGPNETLIFKIELLSINKGSA